MRPASGAVVLGSGQRPGAVDATAARRRGLTVLRRRSGGGVVLVSPADLLWVDVVVPRGDPLWHPDTGRSFLWLGDLWRRALSRSGVAAEVHEGRYEPGAWGSLVCFAGRGPGEVFVAGRKVIGLSQRRTAAGARFQCGVLLRWDPAALADLLVLPAERRETLERDLATCAAGVDLSAQDPGFPPRRPAGRRGQPLGHLSAAEPDDRRKVPRRSARALLVARLPCLVGQSGLLW